ncbi:hypothetical protein ABEB36_012270 [Hypothenemus hampei]|uniref:Jumonji domain-containing protein 4 n=1 Tax=Hypothenemus hampei TaxID=57062 RepID=A0ABD1EAY6_HYPHA
MEFEINNNIEILNQNCVIEVSSVPILDANELSYEEFFENFMSKNRPCLIRNISNNWESTAKWVINGKPNVAYLREQYDHTQVTIYNCSERYYNSQKCQEGTLEQYLKLWEKDNETVYYLKDWHLKLQCKNDNFYEVPIYFASDWLNEYFIQCRNDDYRFVYMGKQGSWTPLHTDVFNSFSWSVNICGQKKWIFFPPSEEKYLKDELNNIPYDIKDTSYSRGYLEAIQNSGEAIFVPSGWYHQVWNLEDTISINHNWINACNINTMWECLKTNLEMTKREIDDCKEMDNFEEHCQTMLEALFGMNFKQFFEFLKFIAEKRMAMMTNQSERQLFHGHFIGTMHIVFDLICIKNVLEDFINCDCAKMNDYYRNLKVLVIEVQNIVCNNNTFIKNLK